MKTGPNWDDNLAGAPEHAIGDPLLKGIEEQVRFAYEQAFMFYLPRICEHCLNPSCVASCPSGAMYKRVEDGIVLVDQHKCRGWRFCVSGCPYKKVYFNHRTGKAEKCTLCYPRIEQGQPTICSETCVGRIRYLGLVLYDADRVEAAASVPDERDLLDAQMGVFLDPDDPEVLAAARADGIPDDWLEAARRSPVYTLAVRYRLALPLHPEYRTLPMVWYVPPLSPVVNALEQRRLRGRPGRPLPRDRDAAHPGRLPRQPARRRRRRRHPLVLRRLAAMRAYMRKREVLGETDETLAASVGLTAHDLRDDVPAARDREVRRALRDPEGARRARLGADGAAGRLRSRLRRRPRQLRRRPAARQRAVHAHARPCRCSARTRRDARAPTHDGPVQAALGPARATPTPAARRGARRARRRRRDAAAIAGTRRARALPRLPRGDTQTELERRYVETFDLRRRSSLYLSYYLHGDTRKRGMALLRLKRLYAAAGLELAGGELPDYLPLVLEFAALAPDGAGEALLREHRPSLELLRANLHAAGSPYAQLLDALCAGLPRLIAARARARPQARRRRATERTGRPASRSRRPR